MGRGNGNTDQLARRCSRRRESWTEERLEAELARFLRHRKSFPSAVELERAGEHGLRYALRRLGGHVYWARRMGFPLRPGQDRRPYGDADARVEIEAIRERYGVVPNVDRLRSLGYPRLASFIMARGGVRAYCTEQGLALPPVRRGLFA